jgi:hypothetical protein
MGRHHTFHATKAAKKPLTDLASYPILTEEVGFPPSPLARQGSGSGQGSAGGLGQMVSKAVNDVLGWKVKPGDSKGLMGALTQSFTLTEVEGRIESKWSPRTYAVQTDLAGGITGAQASLYSRGKVALDQSIPLLDGLYKLDPEAVDEDVAALKAVVKSQLTELVNELGYVGGPRVARVNQYFALLIGASYPTPAVANALVNPTDPDLVAGTLGNLRYELGLTFSGQNGQDFVNSVADETDLSNFRIISDYVTGLAQTWLNNISFVVLNTTTPFFGTQLVLLSRQLSVLAESVDEVRFTLDSVFIGPSERQTMQLNFPLASNLQPIFLEDLLSWIHNFATEEGPRLIQDGGKFGVQNTFFPVAEQLRVIVSYMPAVPKMPPGFYTDRVQLAVADLRDQLRDMAKLAKPIQHVITPEPDFGLPFAVTEVFPNSVSLASMGVLKQVNVTVRGSAFMLGSSSTLPAATFTSSSGSGVMGAPVTYFRSEGILTVTLTVTGGSLGSWDVNVTNGDGTSMPQPLRRAFTVTP